MIVWAIFGLFIAVGQVTAPGQVPSSSAPGTHRATRLDRAGFQITESARVTPGTYRLADPNGAGALVIAGDGLSVDFQGATLIGAADEAAPDSYTGRGIVVRGKNVTIRNANVRGYKIGIYAEDAPGLVVKGCDVSQNYRQRLGSTIEREDLSDWLYGHENDENEWLRYGAGIYLLRCPGAVVEACRARNGQNGLCLVSSDRVRVVDNDLSFMSGWGLAMWRSSDSEIFNNKFDWCMRGYSHGVYARGQDSAGILVYEQCHRNLFAFNSATHGGDGFFLYAGNQTLQETGEGGCNGNIVYQNDFSHAAANGIEATFSQGNVFTKNRLDECTHGIWAGYSYDTIIEANTIRNCEYGVSIEHGRGNRIVDNAITDTKIGVHLWWDEDEDLLATPFCTQRERCPSRHNLVVANRFERVRTAVRLADDQGSRIASNRTSEVGVPVKAVGLVEGLQLALTDAQRQAVEMEGHGEVSYEQPRRPADEWPPSDLAVREPRLLGHRGTQRAFLFPGTPRGRDRIFIDEWGPYDFSDARAFPCEVRGGAKAVLYALGPDVPFRVTDVTGAVRISPMEGDAPARLTAEAAAEGLLPFRMGVEIGDETVTVQGTLLRSPWDVAFYVWSEADDPRGDPEAWRRIVAAEPVARTTAQAIDFMWYSRAPADGVPADRFAVVATTSIALPSGAWRVQTVSDDGVRVLIDDRTVIENWTWHAATTDEARVELDAGRHSIRIEHFEIDGYAQLRFLLEPAAP